MTISAEEIKKFVADASSKRKDWLTIAERSWNEIKKRSSNGKVWIAPTDSEKRFRGKYPVWYSIFKIRQPIVLSRIGEPTGKDTSLDGAGIVSETAAVIIERLAKNLSKTFDFLEVMFDCRDDALATNFGQCRAYYESKIKKERVKVRLTSVVDESTGAVSYFDSATQQPVGGEVEQDEQGYYTETEQIVGVKDEKICLEHVLYKDVLIDPDVTRWRKVKRLAFKLVYSDREFAQIYGAKALAELSLSRDKAEGTKDNKITVYEYWDLLDKKTYWVSEQGNTLLTPKAIADLDYEEGEDDNGQYGLVKFFPSPKPIVFNQPTDEFWPVPEYFQLMEILEDIHAIFNRMLQSVRGIRIVLLYDESVTGLKSALNESSNGSTFGVSNLSQALTGSQGSLDVAAQYLNVLPIIQALNALTVELESRLNTVYKLSGTSDLLQGLITDPTQRTLGERQMTEKYALNQIAEAQKKTAEFVRDSYQLIVEMALNNFEDKTLLKYINYTTLKPEMQQALPAAIELIKDDPERFKVELETDSTTSINEEYDKNMRVELANVLTAALEKTANIAQNNPALVNVELHVLKYLVQSFRQGKLFQQEITTAIDNVIEQTQNAPPEQQFDKAAADAQFRQMKAQIDQQIANSELQLKSYQVQADEKLEYAKLQQQSRIAELEAQLKMLQTQSAIASEESSSQLEAQRLEADIIAAREELQLKQNQMLIELQKVTDKKEYDQLKLAMEAQARASETRLREAEQRLEAFKIQSEEQEKWATEKRLQAEHDLTKLETKANIVSKLKELTEPKTETAVKKKTKKTL